MYKRNLRLPEKPKQKFFLWGKRQTGKTTLLKACYIGRDKSLRYMVGSRNGHVGQGFSPASFDF
jgi:predicted AAA+ superfamily ATPase